MILRPEFKVSGIYRWLNLLNGKVYIGKAKASIKARHSHRKLWGSKLLRRAIAKYGEKHFELSVQEVILRGDMPEEGFAAILKECEQYWMDYYHSWDREFGYNLAPKAESNLGVKHTEESRANFSQGQRRRFDNLEEKNRHKERMRKMGETTEFRRMRSEIQTIYMSKVANREKAKQTTTAYIKDHPEELLRLKEIAKAGAKRSVEKAKAKLEEKLKLTLDICESISVESDGQPFTLSMVKARGREINLRVWNKWLDLLGEAALIQVVRRNCSPLPNLYCYIGGRNDARTGMEEITR